MLAGAWRHREMPDRRRSLGVPGRKRSPTLGELQPDLLGVVEQERLAVRWRALDKAARRKRKVNVDTPRLPIGMKDAAWFVDDTGPIKPEGMDFVDQPGKWRVNRWGPVTVDIVRFHQRAMPDKSRGRPRAMSGRLHSAVKATHAARVAEENQR